KSDDRRLGPLLGPGGRICQPLGALLSRLAPRGASPLALPNPVVLIDSPGQKDRGVAQPGSAPALGAGGRPFKSARPDWRKRNQGARQSRSRSNAPDFLSVESASSSVG